MQCAFWGVALVFRAIHKRQFIEDEGWTKISNTFLKLEAEARKNKYHDGACYNEPILRMLRQKEAVWLEHKFFGSSFTYLKISNFSLL
jgi:hypothetical protein